MARHRLNDSDNDKQWGGPELAERKDAKPHRHDREHGHDRKSHDSESDRSQPPQR